MSGDAAVMRLTGDVDITHVPDIRTRLMGAVDNRDSGLVVDLSEASYLDSAGVNMLFEAAEALRDHQLVMALVVPEGSLVERVVTLVGLESVAPVERDLDAALARVREGS